MVICSYQTLLIRKEDSDLFVFDTQKNNPAKVNKSLILSDFIIMKNKKVMRIKEQPLGIFLFKAAEMVQIKTKSNQN